MDSQAQSIMPNAQPLATSPLLHINNIEIFYGEFQALFGVSLTVEKGETVAIIGANGAGKTTLMRAIAGQLIPASGEIAYQGTSIGPKTAYEMNRLGVALVPEGRKIFPSLTVEENLKIGGYANRNGEWTLDKVYELFPILKERRGNGGTDLSGGQQQMVAIGRALMSNPDLILMDEISLGLAPIVVKDIYAVVTDIVKRGTTIVLVEQDVNRGLQAADRVYCMLEGKVSLSGKPDDLSRDEISKAYFGI
ncbi:MAG: ABC transporter ATP-binding protein [Chloroflexota bacterium]